VIQVWITKEDAANLETIAGKLDAFAKLNPKIKVALIASSEDRKADLGKLKTDEVSVAYIPYGQERIAKQYKINPEAKSTVLVYKSKKVRANFVDLVVDGWEPVLEAAKAAQ
jgi:hypothetical protein